MRNHDFPEVLPEDLKDITVYQEGGRACYFCYNSIIVEQAARRHPEYPHEIGLASYAKNHLCKWWFFTQHGQTILDFHRHYLGKYLGNNTPFEAMKAYMDRKRAEGHRLLEKKDYSETPVPELQEIFDRYFALYLDEMVLAGTLRVIDRQFMLAMRKLMPDSVKADEAIAIAAMPRELPFNVAEELALHEFAADLKNGKVNPQGDEYKKRLRDIENIYAWVVMGYYDEKPKTVRDYDEAVKRLIAADPAEELKYLKDKIHSDRARRGDFVNAAPPQVRDLAEVASWASYLKDYYKYLVNELEYLSEPLFIELSKRSGEPTSFIWDLSIQEIIDLVAGKRPDKSAVMERAERYATVAVPRGRFSVLVGKEADAFVERYIGTVDKNQREFKGRSAAKGVGRGHAKVVLSGDDFHKLKKGDILVVTNTSPDFVAIMKKAAAIVAEEGGITSHTSVVSREFGIPCVVGIADATNIFKDNDSVEVDANNGIVKIIKRA